MHTRLGFFVGLGLGLAFALGTAAGIGLAPHASAQTAGATWEYQTIHHGWDDGRWAATAGAQGWRFVGFDAADGHTLIFERPRH